MCICEGGKKKREGPMRGKEGKEGGSRGNVMSTERERKREGVREGLRGQNGLTIAQIMHNAV